MGDRTCLVEETSVSTQKDGSEEPRILERCSPQTSATFCPHMHLSPVRQKRNMV